MTTASSLMVSALTRAREDVVLNVDFWRREHRSMAASTTGGGGDSITQGRKAWTHFTSVWAMFESGTVWRMARGIGRGAHGYG